MMNRSTTSNDPFPSSFFPFACLPPNNTTTWDPSPNPNPNPSIPSFNYSYASSFIPDTPPDLGSPAGLMPISSFAIGTDQMYTVKAEEVGLNLGHRTYFSSGDAAAIDRLFARSRGVYSLAHQPPRCQAEGCKADLSGAKHYHRRHKVCEFHSKATVVIASGLQQRFCQQCSRFHVLSEFDEAKRSCRKRLADHNRRRRKPQSQSTNSSENNNSNTTTTTTTSTETISKTANGPGLSLGAGGVGGMVNQNQCSTFMSQQQTQSSNTHLYHNSSLFWPSSNEASQSNGGDPEQQQHQQQQQQQQQQLQSNNLLHLGQAMFELDFL